MKKISFILTLILFIQTSLIAEEITYQEDFRKSYRFRTKLKLC